MKHLKFIPFIVIISSCAVAQSGQYGTSDRKAKKYAEAANECLQVTAEKMYPDLDCAIENIEKAIKRDPDYINAYVRLGELYEKKGDLEKAIEINNEVLQKAPGFSSTGLLQYYTARLEIKAGKYEAVKKHCTQYLSFRNPNDDMVADCERWIANADFAIKAMKTPVPFEPKNLGPGVNTENPEYFPALTGDDQRLLFTRLVPDARVSRQMGGAQEDFFISEYQSDKWQHAYSVSDKINTIYNEGAPTLSSDGRILIFTACELMPGDYGEDRNGVGSCDLFYTFKTGDKWTPPDNFGKPLNSFHWETQPSFGSDGKTLYFVRGIRQRGVRRTGKDQDIYVSHFHDKTGWSMPQKLGPKINTPYREESVYIHPDGQTLYFSSDGHPGMGGLDLFMSRKQPNGEWGPAINLGYPINTPGDENSLLVSSSGNIAYFASDRPGGYGSLDIYGFELYENARPIFTNYTKGVVYDDATKKKLEAKFYLIDLSTNDTIVESISDKATGEFLLSLPVNKDYALLVQKPGYHNFSKNFTLKESDTKEAYAVDAPLKPVDSKEGIIALENVFFDLDKATLKPESKIELNNLATFLDKYDHLRIQLRGHTDSQGNDDHNMDLSERRASAVRDYLIDHGIDAGRLESKGFGETMPRIDCGDNCTPAQHAQNRRTEYKILESKLKK